ncbi:MAG: MetQ/NlpA family ABC transporter substrate-binding protein [Endozoicomonas sp. (ex Botrylloides leachii)]|nr:MetQ/NlpA family ABC transporter substrate-binding protein [Endozoicomonas sp. (ex Botrylloides leachii)]
MKALFSLSYLRIFMSAVLATVFLLLAGCSGQEKDPVLKVGVMAGPEADLMQVAIKQLKKNTGIKAKLVEFSDYVAPNMALTDGSIDVNAFQHRPYLDSMIKERGLKLAVVGNTFLYPIGAYSKKIKNIAELKHGAIIAIPNDPSNEGRTLMLLDHEGLITLKDSHDLEATPADIIKNPKDLHFKELDAAQLPRSLDDVDLAFINSTYAVPAGLLPSRDALLLEGSKSAYVNLIVSREDNKTDPRIIALVHAYHSEAVKKKAEELFHGSAIPGWQG